MKATAILLFTLTIGIFTAGKANGQAKVSNSNEIEFRLKNPSTEEVVHILTGGEEKLVISSGNTFLRIVTFKIEDNKILKFAGPIRIIELSMTSDFDGDGEKEITDTMAVLTKSGNLKFVFHLNGAGSALPHGWDF